jgi:sugar (pentulose or hexulose) kinase
MGISGDIIVYGPFAKNPVFARLLAALRPRDCIRLSAGAGAAQGAFLLVAPSKHARALPAEIEPVAVRGLNEYKLSWRERIDLKI